MADKKNSKKAKRNKASPRMIGGNLTDESIRLPNTYERSLPYHTWFADYDEISASFRTGDLLLQHGVVPESQEIQLLFNNYWTHVAIIVKPSDIGLQVPGDPWCYWESNDILTCDDVILGKPKQGPTLVNLEERLYSNLTTAYDVQFLVRHLEVEHTKEMFQAFGEFISSVHSWEFPDSQTGLAIYAKGRVENIDVSKVMNKQVMICSQLTAATYQAMGLLSRHSVPGAYSPGDFLTGSGMALLARAHLTDEILIDPASLKSPPTKAV